MCFFANFCSEASEANSTPEWHDPKNPNKKHNNTNYPVIKKKGPTTPLYKFNKCKGPCNFRNNEATCPVDGKKYNICLKKVEPVFILLKNTGCF